MPVYLIIIILEVSLMRKFSIFILVISCLLIVSCGKSNQINGTSVRTAYRSVKGIKRYLPVEKRIAFEVSFWSMRDAYRDNDEFLDLVDGKTPDEIIEIGKQIFQDRKALGVKKYRDFANWDQMIAHFTQERIDQGKAMKKNKDSRENPPVVYKLRNM